jgi:hypothetical protein
VLNDFSPETALLITRSALFVTTLVFTGIGLHKHRKEGGHCMPSSDVSNGHIEGNNETVQWTEVP